MFNRLKKLLTPKSEEAAPAGDDASDVLVNAYCTVATLPVIDFPHTINNSRDSSDPALAQHLDGFIGYVRSRGDGQMTRTRYHVIRHIQRVRQHVSLSFAQSQFDAFARWAGAANAIAFLVDGSLRDPQGRMLLAANGESAPDAEVPYPPAAWERKARIDALIAEKGIKVPRHLPPLVSEPELHLRTAAEVAGRALALLVVAVRAETLVNEENAISGSELRGRTPLAFDYLTPKEEAFFAQEAPPENEAVQFAWRYECLAVLEWALGLVDPLPFPVDICDVPLTVRTLLDADAAELLRHAALRPASEILDALDLHYRLHWAVRQAQVTESAPPAGLEGGVIQERHYALNWLVRFEEAHWDEVDTPT